MLRPSSMESRFEAFHASGLTALVGREERTRVADAAMVEAKGGEGEVVCCPVE